MRSISTTRAVWALGLGALLVIVAGCAQQPENYAKGEDLPAAPHGTSGNPYREDVRMAGMLAKGTYRPERADDPRNQNILVSVRYITTSVEVYEHVAIGARYIAKPGSEGITELGLTRTDAFDSNGLAAGVYGDGKEFPLSAIQRKDRETKVVEETVGVLNMGQGSIHVGELDTSDQLVIRTPNGNYVLDPGTRREARLAVSPEIIDAERELIRVKVWPELAGMLPRNVAYDESSISATAVVPNGGMLVIGGATTIRPNSLAKEWFVRTRNSRKENLIILLRVWY